MFNRRLARGETFRIRSFVQHLPRHRRTTSALSLSLGFDVVSLLIKIDDMNTQRKSYAHDWLKCKSIRKQIEIRRRDGKGIIKTQPALNWFHRGGEKCFSQLHQIVLGLRMMNWQRRKFAKKNRKAQRKRNCWLKESDQKYCESVRVIEWINCLNYPPKKNEETENEKVRGNAYAGMKKGRSHRNLSCELRPRLKTSTTNTLFH